jgi:hypothetical protein
VAGNNWLVTTPRDCLFTLLLLGSGHARTEHAPLLHASMVSMLPGRRVHVHFFAENHGSFVCLCAGVKSIFAVLEK